jgi:hypothetical protein
MKRAHESVIYDARRVNELRKLVSLGEGLTLEFKRKASFPEKIVREMIAFANTKGGVLLVGINDDGTIPGLKHPEDDAYVIREALKKVKPPIELEEEYISIGNARTVIQYTIPESNKKPHAAHIKPQTWESYVRVNDQSIKASREMIEITRRAQKKKDIRFHYGEHEKWLMKYLDVHQSITLEKFIELTRVKRFYASKKLVLLVLADVLRVTPHEKGDIFSLAFRA